jgi:hypothetical protein
VACYLGKAKNPNASILEMLEPFTHKFCGRAKNQSQGTKSLSFYGRANLC